MRGSAPGKIILLGEHAVVFGHPAIAGSISRRLGVTVEPARDVSVELPGGLRTPPEVVTAAAAIARDAGFEGGFHARIESEIPLGGGLGSSAALGVALARAFRPGVAPDEAVRLAMHLERAMHGAPSGIDPAACARDGLIVFRRGDPPMIEPLRPKVPVHVVIAPTGVARGARSTVMPLGERRQKEPARIDPLLERITRLVGEARGAIEKGEMEALGGAMRENHDLLCALGVSCAELDATVRTLLDAGALGAKLTGAGGGGSAIALARDEAQARAIAQRIPSAFVERLG